MKLLPSIFLGLIGFLVLCGQVLAVTSTQGPILTTIVSGGVTQTLVLKTTTYTECPCDPTPTGGVAAAISNAPVVITTSGGNKLLPGFMIGVIGVVSGVVLL